MRVVVNDGQHSPGALAGLKVVEMAGLGPAPFCAMMLADHGAEVIRIERPAKGTDAVNLPPRFDVLARGRPSIAIDLKHPAGVAAVLQLAASAEVLIEGFRPGVMERLGLGPQECLARNPRLVYGRMTGWGQHGPLAQAAGHDLNYIALAGALHAIGPAQGPPTVPLNYLGDFGGGAMMLAFGLLAAVIEARSSGQGQVVDAAMTDGTALLSSMIHGMRAAGAWSNRRADNLLDGAAPFYRCYLCADGKAIAVGALEPAFYRVLLQRCGIDEAQAPAQYDRAGWPAMDRKLEALFATRNRDHWCALLEGTDACFAPVLDWDEAPHHPHNAARGTFTTVDGVLQAAPAPRLDRTPAAAPSPAQPLAGPAAAERLRAWNFDAEAIERLRDAGALSEG